MLFDSPAYFLFLIPVVLLYWRLSHRAQNIFLLLASYFFYGWWDWRFLALMIGSTTVDFLIAQKIAPGRSDLNRKKWFVFSLLLNFTILGVFKYFDFFAGSLLGALDRLGIHNIPLPLIRILLPPGISFYTFQEVAYIVDVYKGRIEASRSFFDYGLFISLFPHLIACPIQRPGHLLPQVQKERTFDADRFFDGLMLIFSGLIRKCVVADNCAVLANAVFGGQFGPSNFWLVLLGTFAITCTFLSAEVLMANGKPREISSSPWSSPVSGMAQIGPSSSLAPSMAWCWPSSVTFSRLRRRLRVLLPPASPPGSSPSGL